MEQNFSDYFLLQIVLRLNPKSLHSAFVVNAYVLLITIHPLNGNVSHGVPLVFFVKSMLILTPGFSFTLPNLTFIIHTVHHYTIPTYVQSSLTSCHMYLITLQCDLPKWYKNLKLASSWLAGTDPQWDVGPGMMIYLRLIFDN